MNKLSGVLEHFVEQEGVLRLFVRCWDSIGGQALEQTQEEAQDVESQYRICVLLLEDSSFVSNMLCAPLSLGFKENNIVVATKLEGACNTFKAEILNLAEDNLFARLTLACAWAEGGKINALCALDFVKNNHLQLGDFVFWHIPENEIMLFL
ncbi:molybdate ABC transporter [Helicobacter sp.]|uniref:molybdate ABC transporter n=1 Tax=Helicobacter sp. TaxID=218 RepID=UPI0019A66B6B|nr:molybdate ABC transporter [Helicobacter sp.]MBD5165406.1 molybdate ABC transporter [Helicobacter sp.]